MTFEEIKTAIVSLTPEERASILTELCAQTGDSGDQAEGGNPASVREKLAEAAKSHFTPGDRSNSKKILSSLK